MSSILKPLDQDGRVPKERLASSSDSEQVLSQLIYRNQTRSRINAQVQGAIDGNKPLSQAALDAEGLGFLTNINWRLSEGDVNAGQVPFYMLFADVPNYICVKVNPPGYQPMEWQQMSAIIEEELTALVDGWDQFDYRMQLAIRNKVIFGTGPLYFPNKEDFRFEVAPQNTVYVDDEATQDLSKLSMLYLYYEWGIVELFEAIDNENAPENGWDVSAIKKLLTTTCNTSAGYNGGRTKNWVYWQNKLRDHDSWFYTIDAKIATAWSYVKEFNGKITRGLISASPNNPAGNWLFKKVDEFDSWDQIIHPFFTEIGNGHWNGVKGLGIKTFNARDAQNRLKNRMVDAAMVGSQVILQAKDERALESFQIGQMGPYSIINSEITPLQSQIMPDLKGPQAVAQQLEYDLRSNIGSLRQKMGDPNSVQPISAQQAGIQASFEEQLSLGDETMWLRQLDKLYREMVARIFVEPRSATDSYPHEDWEEMVAAFHKRCKDRGVPSAAFKHVKSVKAYRAVGRGSAYLKQQSLGQMYQIMRGDPNVPEQASVNVLRALLASVSSFEALDYVWPSDSIAVAPTNDASKAQDENAGMLWGVEPIWTPDQNNYAHAATHLQFLAIRLEMVQQQQMDPAQFLTMAQVSIPHIELTIQKIPGDRKKGTAYQAMWNAYQQLVSQVTQLSQQYSAQQQALAEEQERQQIIEQQAMITGQMLDPETKLGMARIQADQQLGFAKLQADTQLKAAKTQQQLQTKAATTSQSMAIKDATTRQQLAINDVSTAAKIKNENTKTNASTSKAGK